MGKGTWGRNVIEKKRHNTTLNYPPDVTPPGGTPLIAVHTGTGTVVELGTETIELNGT